jgi:hypothetical protein
MPPRAECRSNQSGRRIATVQCTFTCTHTHGCMCVHMNILECKWEVGEYNDRDIGLLELENLGCESWCHFLIPL